MGPGLPGPASRGVHLVVKEGESQPLSRESLNPEPPGSRSSLGLADPHPSASRAGTLVRCWPEVPSKWTWPRMVYGRETFSAASSPSWDSLFPPPQSPCTSAWPGDPKRTLEHVEGASGCLSIGERCHPAGGPRVQLTPYRVQDGPRTENIPITHQCGRPLQSERKTD